MPDRIEDASQYVELSLQEAGREVCVPDKVFQFTPKKYHLFHYVETGKGTLEYKGVVYNLHAGQFFYIAPGDEPYYKPDPKDPWSYVWLGFAGSNAAKFLKMAGISPEHPVYDDPDRRYKSFFENIENENKSSGYFTLAALGYAYQLFGALAASAPARQTDIDTKRRHVESAKEFIYNNYAFDISADDIAKSVGISPNYLANIFRVVESSSPKKFLTKVRMEKAGLLLATDQYKVKEVAQMVSFRNQLHFSNAFRHYFGVSPSEYKKKGSLRS